MKKLSYISAIIGAISLSSCGLFQPPPSPTPKLVDFKVDQIESGTPMTLIGMVPMDVPNAKQTVVTNNTVFRITTDVVGSPNSTILIPQNSLLSGVYYNDGKSCKISWQDLFGDFRGMELHQGYLGIAKRLNDTTCDPQVGIKPGQTIQVIFK